MQHSILELVELISADSPDGYGVRKRLKGAFANGWEKHGRGLLIFYADQGKEVLRYIPEAEVLIVLSKYSDARDLTLKFMQECRVSTQFVALITDIALKDNHLTSRAFAYQSLLVNVNLKHGKPLSAAWDGKVPAKLGNLPDLTWFEPGYTGRIQR